MTMEIFGGTPWNQGPFITIEKEYKQEEEKNFFLGSNK